ncbi:DUF4365 domain-containing protein [Gottfriedia solisilvae]|uniref:DUF4365 domain-containing protein n=1 Tax=Gottfriedia solisilvae TaxID=1516104 RepID=A0A8J3AG02_9BACI|nr:DUF4365 domain-containing protein [Gottfriedia solisilvae]GGI12593.1 hypothetical protein GCM10007380_13690 [Gottfriedia solisilvae]
MSKSDTLLSQYTENQQREDISRNYVESFFVKKGWKFRKTENDNDIDVEIEIFKERITTAKFIKVQLKSTKDIDIKEELGEVIYDCPVKFLNFCDICEVPVLIFLYDDNTSGGQAYWLFVQKYIYETLERENPTWRLNASKVRIKIPKDNLIIHEDHFYNQLTEISSTGINEIINFRKAKIAEQYFLLLKERRIENDENINLTRIKISIDKTLASSKDAMRIAIKYINENLRNKYKSDQIWIDYFSDIQQSVFGIPFCRTLWKIKQSKENYWGIIDVNEKIDDILIQWVIGHEYFARRIETKQILKENYLEITEKVYTEFLYFYNELYEIINLYTDNNLTEENLKIKVKNIKSKKMPIENFLDFYNKMTSGIVPPFECAEVSKNLSSLVHFINLIWEECIDENFDYMLEYFIDCVQTNFIFKYELRKII